MALLTVKEAATRLGLSVACIRAWIARRRIVIVRLGRAVRVPEDEIRRLIAEGTVPAGPTRTAQTRQAPRAH